MLFKYRVNSPVICDQTGQEWPSVASCAKFFDVTINAIYTRMKNKTAPRRKPRVTALGQFTFSYRPNKIESE